MKCRLSNEMLFLTFTLFSTRYLLYVFNFCNLIQFPKILFTFMLYGRIGIFNYTLKKSLDVTNFIV